MINYGEIVLGFFTLVFLLTSGLAIYSVFGVAFNRRGELRTVLAQTLYWYGVLVLAAAVILVGIPLVLRIASLVWRV